MGGALFRSSLCLGIAFFVYVVYVFMFVFWAVYSRSPSLFIFIALFPHVSTLESEATSSSGGDSKKKK